VHILGASMPKPAVGTYVDQRPPVQPTPQVCAFLDAPGQLKYHVTTRVQAATSFETPQSTIFLLERSHCFGLTDGMERSMELDANTAKTATAQ
jgi:hypothetical protein